MEKGRPSATATFAAMLRAAHLLWDDEPKIFEDTLALQLSGCANEAVLRAQLDQIAVEAAGSTSPALAQTFLHTATAQIVMRSRYVEGELDQAIGRGVAQYVILGAGLAVRPSTRTMFWMLCTVPIWFQD